MALGVTALLPVQRAGAAEFLAGESVRVLVPTAAGSGTDRVVRAFVAAVAELLPGTRFSVENQSGGDGRLAALALWQAPPDGLTWALLSSNLLYASLLEAEALPFDLAGFAWIGGFAKDRRVLVAGARSGLETIEQLRARATPVLLASESTASTNYREALMLNALLDCRIRPVTGYDGPSRVLAARAGEVDCAMGTFESMQPLLADGSGRVLLRLNDATLLPPHDAAPWLGSLPVVPEHAWLVQLIAAQSGMGRCLATAPGTPSDRLQALRALFLQVAALPSFAAAAANIGLALAPTDGGALASRLAALLAGEAGVGARLRAVLECGQRRADGFDAC